MVMVSWLVILLLLVPLIPACILIIVAKTTEELMYKFLYKSIHFRIEETPWLLDTPQNPTIINCIVVMENKLPLESIRDAVSERLVNARKTNGELQYPRACRYIHPGYLNFYWIKERKFEISKHVYEWDKRVYSSEADLKNITSELSNRPLMTDERLSPWEYILIHFKDENNIEKTAIFFRAHHSLSDGVSQIYFLVNRLGDEKINYDGSGHSPLTSAQKFYLKAKAFFLIPYNFLGMLPQSESIKTSFNSTRISGRKQLTYCKPISLKLIKDIKNKFNVTLNDVMLGCLATCIHNYLRNRDEKIPKRFITSIPVDTRFSINEAKEFSNKISITQFALPLSSGDPVKNIQHVHKQMNNMKDYLEGYSIRMGMRIVIYFMPVFLFKMFTRVSIRNVTMNISNMPGPRQVVSIKNNPIKFITFWPPGKDNIATSCSIFSYCGNVYLGMSSDETVTKHPENILADMNDILNSLAGMKVGPKATN